MKDRIGDGKKNLDICGLLVPLTGLNASVYTGSNAHKLQVDECYEHRFAVLIRQSNCIKKYNRTMQSISEKAINN